MRRLHEITTRRFSFFAFAQIWREIGSNVTRENFVGKFDFTKHEDEEETSIIYVAMFLQVEKKERETIFKYENK